MNIWSGSIDLNPDRQLEGIRLVDPTSHWQCDISKTAKLGLRSFINPALIPLHARAGPNLELHTLNAGTSQWFQAKLAGAIWLNQDGLDLHQSVQCPVGLLVSVEGAPSRNTTVVTSDLLIYGVLSTASSCARPPTPPHSSPSDVPGQPNSSPGKPYQLRIYAAPLSTSLITQAQAFPSPPPSSDEERASTQAEFLPDISSPSPKRKRVATLFEVAAQHHRRVRQRGGEAVSQLMASSRPSSSSQNLQTLRIKREPEDDPPSLPTLDRLAARRSRSVSIGAGLHRPVSRLGARGAGTPVPVSGSASSADPQKRTTLPNPFLDPPSRRASGHTQPPSLLSTSISENNLATPSSPPKTTDAIIAENKNLITRTILTCMRLYGFHRSNPRSTSSSFSSKLNPAGQGSAETEPDLRSTTPALETLRAETPAPGAAADDDEFKAMYHATYKASAFALRKYLKDSGAGGAGATPVLLEKGKAMTCIDELLRLFCEDH
ncbi:uncharacterized protein N7496_010871 [Penicillium cataractarum]|uniref:Sld7 C-terminal domain-containing protein n=1 Tax=Penicillium cataractarum TaxID=2100454 RepID=A0A9W9RDX0_9EURO|nr:uncharacterized protein N7496_010871 [Penicillium cataractarum]KAJ5358458.1 hypothetical protein N7496_010871 [Penicillium cataractarum]